LAGIRWHECGKLDYALGADHVVLCLTPDAREFAFSTDPAGEIGQDIVIVAPRTTLAALRAQLGGQFASIEPLAPITIDAALTLPLFRGHDFQGAGVR
jgi:hypothetical protein